MSLAFLVFFFLFPHPRLTFRKITLNKFEMKLFEAAEEKLLTIKQQTIEKLSESLMFFCVLPPFSPVQST
jgi:hypothetical protein